MRKNIFFKKLDDAMLLFQLSLETRPSSTSFDLNSVSNRLRLSRRDAKLITFVRSNVLDVPVIESLDVSAHSSTNSDNKTSSKRYGDMFNNCMNI